MKYLIVTVLAMFSFGFNAQGQVGSNFTNPANQPEELGKVSWLRDFDQAKALANATGKPIFVLFQEVPGCMTCRNYGHDVLSHPLMVELIENEFVPLAIFNNKGGADREVLERYGEPAWNNPVVRIVDQSGADLSDRIASKYSAEAVLASIKKTLQKEGKALPMYAELLAKELSISHAKSEEAVLSMYCFWSGEAHLGAKEGVLATTPGFANGKEVVKVQYDSSILSQAELVQYGAEKKCSLENGGSNFREDKDLQYYLKKSAYRFLPLTTLQRTKINSALANGQDATAFLSPKQKVWLADQNLHTQLRYTENIEVEWQKIVDEK